ncbi:acyl-CoA dehydrogenase family protein [Rhodococcus sp. NPDC127530]|uniref:acyl-CoA dehydrogenase family protein n=1 Tax=unclassified Rhodococcus (in: high G+C Gram-positive bacteria) TaxID=192944 RepID=UPI003639C6D4
MDLLRRAIDDPSARRHVHALLSAAGVWELDPLGDERIELEAAAAVAQVAGEFALPYPVAERLSRAPGSEGTLLVSVREGRQVANHADLELAWTAVDLTGRAFEVVGASGRLSTKLGPFAAEIELRPSHHSAPRLAALATVLHSWWLLGLLRSALADTVRYAGERKQFGHALLEFQSVAFGMADMKVAVDGLEEIAKYALWSVGQDSDGGDALTDALSLRVAALEASHIVMRGAHQYHGAMGFTNEVDVSWLSRASQAVRRLPDGDSVTQELLASMMSTRGFVAVGVPVLEA